ncbi:MAG: lamin tail domain-containing protein, partial [Verrucomicrobiota bacterium]
ATHNAFFSVNGNQLITSHDFSGDLNQTISIRVRVTDSAGHSIERVLTRVVEAPKRHVKINEVNYNPSRNTQLSEFIELYNPFDTEVALGGWYFSKGITYTFPPGATIAPRGYLVVASDPATIQALYGITALGPWVGGLSSDGDSIVLKDNGGAEVDQLDYGITAPWPVPPNGDGSTMELVNPELDNDLGGHWRASTMAPTAVTYVAARGTGWRYRKGTSEASSPVGAWRGESYTEDATWLTGNLPIGLHKKNSNTPVAFLSETGVTLVTQLTDMANWNGSTFIPTYTSLFLRKTFTASGPIPRAILLRVMHNDAAIVWINGTEVGRFGFPPGVNGEVAFNASNYYERGNDPWSEVVLLNAGALIHAGTNTIAIQGFSKMPVIRSQQDSPGDYNLFDFSIDAELKNPSEFFGTPGAQNSVFVANGAPAIRDVNHLPAAPKSFEPVTVTARIADKEGVGAVQLLYQVCAPGGFIPSTLPLTNAQMLAAPPNALPNNPAFEAAANWITTTMVDDGSIASDIPGDGIFTGQIPPRPHRTLVRYRILANDLQGASVRIPAADDPRKNYAYYVYNGVPDYVASGKVYSASTLKTLPVYHWITRATDFSSLLAYNASEQFANSIDLNALLARRFENFEGALVVGDQVIDHTHIRLRGGNSRYNGSGKRHFRFKFPKGSPLDATDEQGRSYPRPWEEMLFNKMFGNKGYYDWGLPYEAAGHVWRLLGIPIPDSHWVHFRVVRSADEAASAVNGDFWGLYQALELPEGKNFLKARDLPLGNFFKMSDWTQNGEMDERYQAKGAPDFGEDFDNIRYNIHQKATDAYIKTYVNMPLWYRYNAVQEAIRHYDIFTEPTGRHRVKNLLWYFEPKANTNGLGYLWAMPYDWDASFGPNYNNGWDVVHNAMYNHDDFTDSPTWIGNKLTPRTAMAIEHRNAIRELRDLIWYRDSNTGRGPFDDILDDAAATLGAFWPADRARWPVTGAVADNAGGMPFKVQDMKNFAFTGWTDTTGIGDPAVGAGGRAAFLDSISDALDNGQLPIKPTITYGGSASFPADGIVLKSTSFNDPQGAPTFAAMQWRIGEVTDPAAPAFDPTALRMYEVTPVWESGELATFNGTIAVPGNVLRSGHAYRARVRHKDATGRWSHWSAPLAFTAGLSDYTEVLHENLVISEIMYHPLAPSASEAALGYVESDFEYIELRNISDALTLDLINVRLTKGVDFDFAGSAITTLSPKGTVLIVKNSAAFNLRYGAGKPIAGMWESSDSLSNGGEEVKLSYGAGAAIQAFIYDDATPWPTLADTGGYSLVLKKPESRPDPTVATNWRASFAPGGTPGGDDRTTDRDRSGEGEQV